MLAFSVENLINCVQNERALWDLRADSSEEGTELACHRVYNVAAESLKLNSTGYIHLNYKTYKYSGNSLVFTA